MILPSTTLAVDGSITCGRMVCDNQGCDSKKTFQEKMMAIYHFRVTKIGRSKGQSAVASAAYYSNERLLDQRTGIRHVMPPRAGLLHDEILFPPHVQRSETLDRERFWNMVESHEKRSDANTALLWYVALPSELATKDAIRLAQSFSRYLIDRFGFVIDLTVRETSPGALVAYLLSSTRQMIGDGFRSKIVFLLSGPDRERLGLPKAPRTDLMEIRLRWAELVNSALAEIGSSARVDHRSLKDRGFDLIPQTHLGSAAARRTRRGEDLDRKSGSAERDTYNAQRIMARPGMLRDLIESEGESFDEENARRAVHRYVDDPELRDRLYALVLQAG